MAKITYFLALILKVNFKASLFSKKNDVDQPFQCFLAFFDQEQLELESRIFESLFQGALSRLYPPFA